MKIIITILLALFFTEGFSQIYSSANSHAEIHGDAPVGDYTGVSDQLNGWVNFNNGEVHFILPLKSLKTGNNKRDKHMYETLDANTYPNAEFSGTIISPYDLNNSDPQNIQVKGLFSVHGQQVEITVPAIIDPAENNIGFESGFDIQITDFGMERPSVGFFKTDDKHTIKINGLLMGTPSNAQTKSDSV